MANGFDMILNVNVDGHIGFMENDSFSYQSVGRLLKCSLCAAKTKHNHTPVYAIIRHQFSHSGTWAIYGTTNHTSYIHARNKTGATRWHEIGL